MPLDKDAVASQIAAAFASMEYPGDWNLSGSREGDEPHLVARDFKGESFAAALSFFSDEAFRFYLPAYLIADLRGQLFHADPVFHLTHGLDRASRHTLINPRRYGSRTWSDHARHKFSMFSSDEAKAIAAYMTVKRDEDECERQRIDEALEVYWSSR